MRLLHQALDGKRGSGHWPRIGSGETAKVQKTGVGHSIAAGAESLESRHAVSPYQGVLEGVCGVADETPQQAVGGRSRPLSGGRSAGRSPPYQHGVWLVAAGKPNAGL